MSTCQDPLEKSRPIYETLPRGSQHVGTQFLKHCKETFNLPPFVGKSAILCYTAILPCLLPWNGSTLQRCCFITFGPVKRVPNKMIITCHILTLEIYGTAEKNIKMAPGFIT